jgi:hypothetical protein
MLIFRLFEGVGAEEWKELEKGVLVILWGIQESMSEVLSSVLTSSSGHAMAPQWVF